MPVATLPPLQVEPLSCADLRTDPYIVARRNNSLGSRQLWAVFGGLAAFSLALACAFAMAGAWMVLPYSILEFVLIGLAFRLVERRAGDWERLVVTGDRVLWKDRRVAAWNDVNSTSAGCAWNAKARLGAARRGALFVDSARSQR